MLRRVLLSSFAPVAACARSRVPVAALTTLPPQVPPMASPSTADSAAGAESLPPAAHVAATIIGRRNADMRASYEAMVDTFPPHAQPPQGEGATVDKIEAYRKRLIYRSKQRGW